jgi:hypothetical protein
MTWKCVTKRGDTTRRPDAAVQLRFVEDSTVGMVVESDSLCESLRTAGKLVVPVDFLVSGNTIHGLVGYRYTAINGIPVANQEPENIIAFQEGHSGKPHPLAAPFK